MHSCLAGNRRTRHHALHALLCLAAMGVTQAVAAPRIGYVYPAGGRRGTTFRVEVGGQGLATVNAIRVSGKGVSAAVVDHIRPLDNQDRRDAGRFLRDIVRRRWDAGTKAQYDARTDKPPLPDHPWLRDLDTATPADLDRLRTRLFDPKRQPNAQLDEKVILDLTIDDDAAAGDREFRLLGADGLSNPLCFQIGVLPEINEEVFAGTGTGGGTVVALPALLNGQITPGDTDRIVFRATAGQKLVIRLQARHLIPYLADAVPGWFQAVMILRDSAGRDIAWSDDYRFDPDPVILYEAPADGTYELVLRDAIYRGRDDFVYRIAIGELPFVTSVFPLSVAAGSTRTAIIKGWNLPANTITLDGRDDGPGTRHVSLGQEGDLVHRIPYTVTPFPHSCETEPNAADQPNAIPFPACVAGTMSPAGDTDVFTFEGTAGQEIVVELVARQLRSPIDGVLRLTDASGKQIALNDDPSERRLGLMTHQADPAIRITLPEDGRYSIHVSDARGHGGGAYVYSLAVRPPAPNALVCVAPSALSVAPGRSAKVTAHVLRRDGFEGPVTVTLAGAPAGFVLGTARIPADGDRVEASVVAPRDAAPGVHTLRFEADAGPDDAAVTCRAIPAEDMMQAFLWRFLVPYAEQLVAVTGSRPVPAVWRPLVKGVAPPAPNPVRVPPGDTADVPLAFSETADTAPGNGWQDVEYRLANRPRGISLQRVRLQDNRLVLVLKADAYTSLPGDAANLLIEATGRPAAERPWEGHGAAHLRESIGILPPIPIEVVRWSSTRVEARSQ